MRWKTRRPHRGKENMSMKDTWGREVRVDTDYWKAATENAWTGKEPRGKGKWAFHFGGYTYGETPSTDFVFNGLYSAAKREAIRQCAAKGLCMVVVLA